MTASAFQYDDLVDLIQTRNLKNVDEVVPLLPQEFRNNFTLMKDSQSLQKSDYLNPRVIMYNDNAQTVITFGGLPNEKASANFEVMQYDTHSKTFRLHEISFDSGQVHVANQHEIKNKCTSCHGEFVRPIWQSYPNWIGSYGEKDDYLTPSEHRQYQEFREKNLDRPAFKALFAGHENDSYWPYSLSFKERLDSRMPNFRLNVLLSLNWAEAAANRIINSPMWQHAKYSVMFATRFSGASPANEIAMLEKVMPLPKGIPAKRILQFFDIPYGDLSLFLERGFGQYTNTGIYIGSGKKDSDGYVSAMLALELAKTDPRVIKLSNSRYVYGGTDNTYGNVPDGFRNVIENSPVAAEFRVDQDYMRLKTDEEKERFRTHPPSLIKESTNQPTSTLDTRNGKELLSTAGCVSCHQSGFAPRIHFDDASIFANENNLAKRAGQSLIQRAQLRMDETDVRRRMPFGGRSLSPSEQQSILLYLNLMAAEK